MVWMIRSVDGPLHLGPETFHATLFLGSCRAALWQTRRAELDPARRFEISEKPPAVGDEFIRAERLLRPEHDTRHDDFAPLRIGNSKDGRFGYGGMRKNHSLTSLEKTFSPPVSIMSFKRSRM